MKKIKLYGLVGAFIISQVLVPSMQLQALDDKTTTKTNEIAEETKVETKTDTVTKEIVSSVDSTVDTKEVIVEETKIIVEEVVTNEVIVEETETEIIVQETETEIIVEEVVTNNESDDDNEVIVEEVEVEIIVPEVVNNEESDDDNYEVEESFESDEKDYTELERVYFTLLEKYNALIEFKDSLNNKIEGLENKLTLDSERVDDEKTPQIINEDLTNQLRGRILIKSEDRGQAYYVNPGDGKKYFMGDGNSAYSILRNFSLGINNSDISRIPIGIDDRINYIDTDNDNLPDILEEALGSDKYNQDTDGDGYLDGQEVRNGYNLFNDSSIKLPVDNTLIDRLRGRFLIQTEQSGQSWYINPDDGHRYYVPDGDSAFDLLRLQSLGVENADLDQIEDGELIEEENTEFITSVDYDYPIDELIAQLPSTRNSSIGNNQSVSQVGDEETEDEINISAIWDVSPDQINQEIGESIVPMQLIIYSNISRVTNNWTFYYQGEIGDAPIAGSLTGADGQVLTPTALAFEQVGEDLYSFTFFNMPTALMIVPNVANVLNLNIITSTLHTLNGQFYMTPEDIEFNPENELFWSEDPIYGSEVNITEPSNQEPGELFVTVEDNPAIANIIAGTSDVPMLNLKFQAVNESFNINNLTVSMIHSTRSVDSVTISYLNETGETITANQVEISGAANFNITSNPFYVPANTYRIMNVYFSVPAINQTYAAYTGDIIQAEYSTYDNFEAIGVEYDTQLTQLSNHPLKLYSNIMTVHGTVPTFIVDSTTNTSLVNGPAELYRWEVSAPEGGTDLSLKKLSFKLSMNDSVQNTSTLSLSNFRVYEGTSYASATLLTQGDSGTDSYQVYNGWGATTTIAGNEFGGKLSAPTGVLYQNSQGLTPSTTHDVIIVFNDDRLISAGSSRYYILKATAGNVNTGVLSNDYIGMYIYDGDTATTHRMTLEPTCDADGTSGTDSKYCLSSDGNNDDVGAYMIWSDNTGTNGNNTHTDVNLYGLSSADWFNGYKINTLDVIRLLN